MNNYYIPYIPKYKTENEIITIYKNMNYVLDNIHTIWNNGGLLLVYRWFDFWNDPLSINSAGIRWATESFWNHTAISCVVEGTPHVIESNMKGVVLEPLEYWLENYGKNKLWVYMPSNKIFDYNNDIKPWIGKKYDYKGVYLFQFYYQITRKLNKLLNNNNTGHWIGEEGCSAKEKTWCTEIYSYLHNIPEAEKLHSGDLAKYYNL